MFATVLVALALASDSGNAIPIDAAKALHDSHSAVLYSLEPWDRPVNGEPVLNGYKILGKTRIDGEAYRIATEEFEASAARSDNTAQAACFDPRHAIRVAAHGHQFEFLLCYACHQLVVYRDGKRVAMLGASGSSKALNALLVAAKVPVSTSYDEDAELARAVMQREAYSRWREAMPRALSAFPSLDDPFIGADVIARMGIALAQEHRKSTEHILALYAWYGSGAGPWSGFPAYESVAEELLMTHSTEELLAPLGSEKLSEAQVEGAARLFGGWTFSKKRPGDLTRLSDALKARLLGHSLRSDDKDKRGRAQHAFGAQ